MEELKKILFEMEYIYEIFDDIKNLYHSLKNKDEIYNTYNINDLILLDIISVLCNHMMYYYLVCIDDNFILKSKIDIFCNEIIDTYNKLKNTTTEETLSLKEALRYRNEFFVYDNKDYIYFVKNNLNIILNSMY